MKKLLLFTSAFCVTFSALAVSDAAREAARKKAAEMVSLMTPSEKLEQLMMKSPAIKRLNINSYHWWNEVLHGVARSGLATVFPQSIGLAATFDEDLVKRIADVIAIESRAKYNIYQSMGEYGIYQGLTMWSPNVNMFRDPRWGRGQETFGEDPFLTSLLGSAFVKGLQGDNDKWLMAAACAKHYVVHSGPENERHAFNAKASKRECAEYYFPAFKSLVMDANVESVMTAYNRANSEPCTASRYLLTDLLRKEWGFKGHIVSDVGAVDDIYKNHRIIEKATDVPYATIAAGLDLCSSTQYACLRKGIKEGKFSAEPFDKPLINLFMTRILLGEFEKDGSLPWDKLGASDVDTPASRELAIDAAVKSLVLIKNNGILPLRRNVHKRISVLGPLATDEVVLYGNYNGYSSVPSTCMSGLVTEAGPGWPIVSYLQLDDDSTKNTAIACVGYTANEEGEEGSGGDRKNYSIPEKDLQLLKMLNKRKVPTIAVVFGGSPIDLKEIADLCDAVIVAWYPGQGGGRAIARTIFGKANFSGRLPITYPQSYNDLPDFKDYSLKGRTYRYAEKKPAYPFGYGLSYTTFGYSAIKTVKKGDVTIATVSVTNTGKVDGDEIVQLYIQSPSSARDARLIHLEGAKRVSLKSGETKEVSFTLTKKSFEVFDEEGKPSIPRGEYAIHIGGGQPNYTKTSTTTVGF
ncbi:MAG: glycoside hydrolase family 3 C-terminal domain-containing protein [Kiritimatiellae bacterium]|nr:glycoside hydrolase family 3 C-terminal domain-containing protein [Kiritimatiellia bacterium]